jgi:hypothetical protein
MRKIALLLLISMVVLVGSVSALPQNWIIQNSVHTGTIILNGDGTGSATVDSYPTISFTYEITDTSITARYWWWSLSGQYDPVQNVITFERFPGAELVPIK